MKDCYFIFDFVNLLHYIRHKINPKRGGSKKKSKKAIINSINYDYKYFQYASALALNYEEIGKKSKII